MWPIKFKPHSRFALTFCIFPKRMLGVFCNFPKQNTRYSYIFPKIFVWRLLVLGTPLYDKKVLQSCGIYRKITHSARLRAYWFIHFPDSPQILYEVLQFPIKHNLHLMSIHELYDTLIWSKIHRFLHKSTHWAVLHAKSFHFHLTYCTDRMLVTH